MNMAGVVASPTSVTAAPDDDAPAAAAAASAQPERRESRPSATRTSALPSRSASHTANALTKVASR